MSDKIKILITLPFKKADIESIESDFPEVQITHMPSRLGEEISDQQWMDTEILFTGRAIPTEQQAPNLAWVQLYSAGVDRFLDNPLLKKSGLQVTSISGANASQVAEHAVGMLLALGRRLPAIMRHQAENDWPSDRGKLFEPQELRSATVGIVGYGSVGRQVARLLQNFGATILATKVDLMNLKDEDYAAENQGDQSGDIPIRIYPAEALKSMFKDCDFIVIAAPLTNKTKGMIAGEQLAAMKKTAYLVDVSRGGIIDHEALLEALQTNKIAGAALDVFHEEPLALDHPLWDLENVIISPHIAGQSSHADERAIELFKENLNRYIDGQLLLNLISVDKGY